MKGVSTLDLNISVLQMSSKAMREYTFHYLDRDTIMEQLLRKATKGEGFCIGCLAIVTDDDVNASDCPCGFDYMDNDCERWYIINHYLPYLIQADLSLREELGDVYPD